MFLGRDSLRDVGRPNPIPFSTRHTAGGQDVDRREGEGKETSGSNTGRVRLPAEETVPREERMRPDKERFCLSQKRFNLLAGWQVLRDVAGDAAYRVKKYDHREEREETCSDQAPGAQQCDQPGSGK